MLPLSVLAPAIPGYAMMVCRLTGTVVSADCAGALANDAPVPAPLVPRWAAASCCDVLRVTFDRAPAEAHLDEPALTAVLAHAVPARWSVPLPRASVHGDGARAPAPPGMGPPRRFVTQSFLI